MRRWLLLAVIPCALVFGANGAAGAGKSSTYTWHYFHIHMNAYAHWGDCNGIPVGMSISEWGGSHWQTHGICRGSFEAGQFLNTDYGVYHSKDVGWRWWDAVNDQRTITVSSYSIGPAFSLHGHMPYNWHTFTVTSAHLGDHYYVTGTTHAKGEPGGPLYVDLSSHTYWDGSFGTAEGYSLDLRGYLRAQ
jgi:hypothetical protein